MLDEPTSALDPISSSQIETTLLKLRTDYTIITVTHNLQQASRISDRTAFFMNGEVIEMDDTKKIFMNPARVQTVKITLVAVSNLRRVRMRRLFDEELDELDNGFH